MKDKNHSAAAAALLSGSTTLRAGRADVFRQRERTKRKRLLRAILVVSAIDVWLWWRYSTGRPLRLPSRDQRQPRMAGDGLDPATLRTQQHETAQETAHYECAGRT